MPTLEREDLEALAQRVAALPEGSDVSDEDAALFAELSPEDVAAFEARVAEIKTPAPEASQETKAAEDVPADADGYALVLSTTANHDDGDDKITFNDLLPTTEIEHLDGVSVSLDKPVVSSKHGTMRARIITDVGGRAYVLRKDFPDETTEHGIGVTRFRVKFNIGAA